MACPSCGGKTHITREYLDDGSSYAYGVCQVCGWDDADEQLADMRDQLAEVEELLNSSDIRELELDEYEYSGDDDDEL